MNSSYTSTIHKLAHDNYKNEKLEEENWPKREENGCFINIEKFGAIFVLHSNSLTLCLLHGLAKRSKSGAARH